MAYFAFSNSSDEKTILKILQSLQVFDSYVSNIFKSTDIRLSEMKNRINGLKERIKEVENKLRLIEKSPGTVSFNIKANYDGSNDFKSSEIFLPCNCFQSVRMSDFKPEMLHQQHFKDSYSHKKEFHAIVNSEPTLFSNAILSTSNNNCKNKSSKKNNSFDEESLIFEDVFSEIDFSHSLSYKPEVSNKSIQNFEFPEIFPTFQSSFKPKSVDLVKEQSASTAVVSNKTEKSQNETKEIEKSMEPTEKPIVSQQPTVAPPPPPPPPPPPLAKIAPVVAPSSLSTADGRANLMESIRAIGGIKGANLRKVSKEEEQEETESASTSHSKAKPNPIESQDDDLMSSLAKALEKRRKGLSGNTTQKSRGHQKHVTNNPLSNLRERIPIIEEPHGDSTLSDSDDEWSK